MAIKAGQRVTAAHLSWNSSAVSLTDDSPNAEDAWEQWGTETIVFPNPGIEVLVRAWVSGRLRNFSAGTATGSARVEISLDGGNTFTRGFAYSVDCNADIPRVSMSTTGYASGVPTGDIVIRALMTSTSTNTFFEAGGLMADVFPRGGGD